VEVKRRADRFIVRSGWVVCQSSLLRNVRRTEAIVKTSLSVGIKIASEMNEKKMIIFSI